MANDTTTEVSSVLQNLSLGYIIGLFVSVLASSLTLYASVRLVGGKPSFKKSIALAVFMEVINLIVLPMFTTGLFSVFLYLLIWLILAIAFFELPPWKALIVSLIQGVLTEVFLTFGIVALITVSIGSVLLIW